MMMSLEAILKLLASVLNSDWRRTLFKGRENRLEDRRPAWGAGFEFDRQSARGRE